MLKSGYTKYALVQFNETNVGYYTESVLYPVRSPADRETFYPILCYLLISLYTYTRLGKNNDGGGWEQIQCV